MAVFGIVVHICPCLQVYPACMGYYIISYLSFVAPSPFIFGWRIGRHDWKEYIMTNTKTTKTASAKRCFLPARGNRAENQALRDMRNIVSKKTGEVNRLLVFDNDDVVMPGNWVVRADEFPEGIYEGIHLDAWWEPDDSGVDRFHLANRDK